jgi:hypothetical protein
MWVNEREFAIAGEPEEGDYFSHIINELEVILSDDELSLRFVITESTPAGITGEALILHSADAYVDRPSIAPLGLVRRDFENTSSFNTVLVVPTGIGSEIGGHAGDAGPVAKLLASVCDSVITHPNVVNASDITNFRPTHFMLKEVFSRACCLVPLVFSRFEGIAFLSSSTSIATLHSPTQPSIRLMQQEPPMDWNARTCCV